MKIQGPGAPAFRPGVRRRAVDPGTFDRALEQVTGTQTPQKPAATEVGGLRFSKHALARLASRGVSLDARETERLNEALTALQAKGAQEALVVTPDNAYVLGVPKATVITAMARSEALGQVFTIIDSTFIHPDR